MAADAIEDSLNRLSIRDGANGEGSDAAPEAPGEVEDEASSQSTAEDGGAVRCEQRSSSVAPTTPPRPGPPMLVCDAWYGFPTQKRPRRERINAVARQLSNFLEWRSLSEGGSDINGALCGISLLGGEGDVGPVRERMDEINGQCHSSSRPTTTWEGSEVSSECDVAIGEFLDRQKASSTDAGIESTGEEDLVYLSPDASNTLSATSPPPRIVIVGMLIDRRVTADRSRARAEGTLNLRAAKLPMDELNVRGLTSREPLNVDTVMELMQRWWWNCDGMERQQEEWDKKANGSGDESRSGAYRKCFIEAAAWAMKTQRERHPNRTVHNATTHKKE